VSFLVGCPVLHREWVLDVWFDHVEASAAEAGIDPQFIFVGDPERDPATFEVIGRRAPAAMVIAVDDVKPQDNRQWNDRRYRRMVELRNHLLDGVRSIGPDLFLSLDSDILIPPGCIGDLVQHVVPQGGFDAVGGFTHLAEYGEGAPSIGKISKRGKLQRKGLAQGVHTVDVIMAIKLMTPTAYNMDYVHDRDGEDIGWSKNCRKHGVILGYSTNHPAKHLFTRDRLEMEDKRIGW